MGGSPFFSTWRVRNYCIQYTTLYKLYEQCTIFRNVNPGYTVDMEVDPENTLLIPSFFLYFTCNHLHILQASTICVNKVLLLNQFSSFPLGSQVSINCPEVSKSTHIWVIQCCSRLPQSNVRSQDMVARMNNSRT